MAASTLDGTPLVEAGDWHSQRGSTTSWGPEADHCTQRFGYAMVATITQCIGPDVLVVSSSSDPCIGEFGRSHRRARE